MKYFVGIVSSSLCNNLISQCTKHEVEPFYGNKDLEPEDMFYDDHLLQKQLAIKAGYRDGNSIEFRHYYYPQHFDFSFIKEIESLTNTKHLKSFVSEIKPGKCAPWHWDINPDLKHYPVNLVERFVCFINKPKFGQAFMIEEECFYMEPQGNIYRYPNLNSWHAGFNAGLETKFLFTFTGLVLS